MPQGLLLDAAADLLDALVRQPHHMPVIDDQRRVSEVDTHRRRVPPIRVQRHDTDPRQPLRITACQPAGDRLGGAILDDVEQLPGAGVDRPDTNSV